jgi:hypothetical protein
MEVKKVIKTPKGEFTFEGNLSQEELDVIVTVGIGYLLEKGALPLLTEIDENLDVSALSGLQ